ncbi:PC4 and SFRS1-interacting protein-like [Hibiscus syriacus]|uniref:PC4 and SFRS1-interacting protein-like n=1 Tax=Hibiscus syriacus TaxID=106335 RepID=UPI001921842A|nr:PC4 and SFRS1-interacting protein-like [Hibiscus syriacus]
MDRAQMSVLPPGVDGIYSHSIPTLEFITHPFGLDDQFENGSGARESSLGKDKKPTCPSKSNASITHGQGIRRHSMGSTLANNSTKSDAATKNVKKTATHTSQPQPQRPNPLRKSIARPVSTDPIRKKPLVPPTPQKLATTPKSASFSSKSTISLRSTEPPIAAKPPTSSYSSRTRTMTTTMMTMTARSMKAQPSPFPTSKRGTTTSASNKPPLTHGIKQAKNLETKHENKENLDRQVGEVVKDEKSNIHDIKIPKAKEETQQHDHVEEEKEKYTLENVSSVTHDQKQHQVPQTEEMKDKAHEQELDDSNSDEKAKDNDNKEEINVTHEETKTKTKAKEVEEGNTTEEVAATKESEEENNDEGKKQGLELVEEEANVVSQSQVEAEAEDGEKETVEQEANVVLESQVQAEASEGKQEIVEEETKSRVQAEATQGKQETVEEEANMVPESQVQAEAVNVTKEKVEKGTNLVAKNQVQAKVANGKNNPPTPNGVVVKMTVSKLVTERKGSVRALVGAFESHGKNKGRVRALIGAFESHR